MLDRRVARHEVHEQEQAALVQAAIRASRSASVPYSAATSV